MYTKLGVFSIDVTTPIIFPPFKLWVAENNASANRSGFVIRETYMKYGTWTNVCSGGTILTPNGTRILEKRSTIPQNKKTNKSP